MYFMLNINLNGKSQVDYWISNRKIAPIFYENSTIDQIKDDYGHNIPKIAYLDAKLFVDTFYDNINSDAIIFSIGEKNVYFYKQIEKIHIIENYIDGTVKGFAIELLKTVKITHCPLVLVTIKSNRYISSGTFKKIDGDLYDGNINAINYILSEKKQNVNSFDKYLQCLSSLEFETLIAKLFEEKGFFVPAYKGGFIKNYDLFCRNITKKEIVIFNTKIVPESILSVQLKLRLKKQHLDNLNDMYICIWKEVNNNNIHDYTDIEEEIKSTPKTLEWLKYCLDWVDWKFT